MCGFSPNVEIIDPLTGNRAVYCLQAVFFNTTVVIPAGLPPVPTAPPMENVSVEDPSHEEVMAAGDEFFAETEAVQTAKTIVDEFDGDDLDAHLRRIMNDLKEGLATHNVDLLKEALQDWDVRDEFDADEDRVEKEVAHVVDLMEKEAAQEAQRLEEEGRAQEAQRLMGELKELFLELKKLNDDQMPLYKQCMAMRKKASGPGGEKNPAYWPTWNKMIDIQKRWRATYEALRAHEDKVAAAHKDFDFQALAVEWNPDKEFKGDYKQLYKAIEANFKRNIESDTALQERGKAMFEGNGPKTRTVADFVEKILAKEAGV